MTPKCVGTLYCRFAKFSQCTIRNNGESPENTNTFPREMAAVLHGAGETASPTEPPGEVWGSTSTALEALAPIASERSEAPSYLGGNQEN